MTEFAQWLSDHHLKMAQVARRFEIPYRTIQDWKNGNGNCPKYVLNMLKEIYK